MRESIFKSVFLRGGTETSAWKWLIMLPLELYVGEHLIEMLSNTASYNHETREPKIGSETNGWRKPIADFIPASMINNLLKNKIVELLKDKYLKHYSLIKQSESYSGDAPERFELNHGKLHLLTELKLAYNTTWVLLNVAVDLLVYLITKDLTATLLAGALVEVLRRLKI
ncbi:hypothetical protein E0D86_09985 [Pseudomonas sp. IC_126]|uniref:hypothetical protein n=1 Tax=Pseudomonas sp. IC_126 TaxID=2547400 RepID=UPI00103D37C0|nr:hypothetical protein [Pseudomonas sp. IC_126]TCD22949.1 hypothetical protein E0D86_09985 [Pseudomonas sp. IC_126]